MKKKSVVLIIDDDFEYLKDMKTLLGAEFDVKTTVIPEIGLEFIKEENIETVLLDIDFQGKKNGLNLIEEIKAYAPNLPIIMVSYFDKPDIIVEAMQKGAVDYIHKLSNMEYFISRVKEAVRHFKAESSINDYEFLFVSSAMKKVMEEIETVAATNSTVLLTGESGVGKTMLAKIIHMKSQKKGRFVTLNVPSVTPTLFESELFGHKRGAFTGAVSDKKGRVELAENGTLFLDEISETSVEIQAKLLRLLEEKEYEKVGDTEPKTANVRIIAATNKNLKNLINSGKFRGDLYYRLSHYTIEIPPLRERKKDIPLLANSFLEKICLEYEKGKKFFDENALSILCEYDWPGNVRELRNVVERIVIKTNGKKRLTENDVKQNIKGDWGDNEQFIRFDDYKERELQKIKFRYFHSLLQKTTGNISKTARMAGISRQSLYRFLNELGIQINGEV